MRLLDTHTGQFVEKDPDDEKTVYAILSHTWDKDSEQTYEQLRDIQRRYPSPVQNGRPGGPKGDSSYVSSRKWNQDGTPPTPFSSQPPGESISGATHPEEALEHLIQSKMEGLLRDFFRKYEFAVPTPAAASIWEDPDLSPKIRDACRVARENGYRYIWIDSCCIDKSSSSELSEAINSMYKWYGLAAVCYAYLADVPPGKDHRAEGSSFRKSQWFKRGWTLQELIAPLSVEFLSQDWAPIGSKHDLVDLVENITEINEKALLQLESLSTFSIAQRFSWAAGRKTTREEDQAYSLLGIFDINMPTLYGEGNRAFRRLQEQIMQYIPDQSLFAWGDVYLSSQLVSADPIWEAWPSTHNDWEYLFTPSPGPFKVSGNINTHAHHKAIQLTSSHRREMIEYTSTPYGIRTQFWMIPLTRDLLLHATQWHHKDVQLEFSQSSPENFQWYLTILGCEHSEYPGHLLGRVCYIAPSESGVECLYPGYIHGLYLQHRRHYEYVPNMFPLSSETIQHYHQHIELKMVYISHLNHASLASSLKYRPYTAIKVTLLRATHDTLRSRGYSADLRDPDLAHPTTQWLTLSNDEHTITIEFQNSLEKGGNHFTITAEVKMSVSNVPLDPTLRSDRAEHHTVSWWDSVWRAGWRTRLDHESVRLGAAGTGTLTVDLGLDFAGRGVYFLRVDVLREAPSASSAVEPAVIDQADEGEKTKEGTSSGAIDTEDVDREDTEGTGGGERAPIASVEARDAVATNDNTESGDGGGVLA